MNSVPQSVRRQPTVHQYGLSGYIICRRARQITGQSRDIGFSAKAFEGYAVYHHLPACRVRAQRFFARGRLGGAGRDSVNTYGVLGPFDGEHARHLGNAGFADAVCRYIADAYDAVRGCDADDAAFAFGADQVAAHLLAHEKCAGEIDVHHHRPFVSCHVDDGLAQQHACIVDQKVECAERAEHLLHAGFDAGLCAHVQCDWHSACAVRFNVLNRIGEGIGSELGDGDVVTITCQCAGDGCTDAIGGTGNQRSAACC